MKTKGQSEGEFNHDLRSRVVVADIALPGVGRQEQSASHPVRQHTNVLGLLLVRGVEMEQHALLLHSHQAFIEPGSLSCALTRLS